MRDDICQFWKLMVLFALFFAFNKRTACQMIKVERIQVDTYKRNGDREGESKYLLKIKARYISSILLLIFEK